MGAGCRWSLCMPHIKLTRAASTELQRPSHDHKAVWAFAGGAAWCERKRKGHFPRAVSNGVDDHSAAVKTWLHKFIIGKNFCPWAKSVSDNDSVRVVTSLATTEDGILRDLEEEVAALPSCPNVPEGVPSTTLLVCPHVSSWQDFDTFNEFYGNALRNGVLFEENFKVKLVAFHPSFIHSPLYGPVLEVGDVLTLPTSEGEVDATVLDADVEAEEPGEAFRVQLENGEEQVISYARLAELLQDSQYETVEDADEDGEDAEIEMDEETEILENMAQRAPRPTFHLLRLCDDPLLQRIAAGGRSYSFRTGLMSLIDALEEQLLNPAPGTNAVEIRRNSAIDRLQAPKDGTKAQVLLRDGSRVEADCVIAAIQPTVLGELLKTSGLDLSVSTGQSLCQLLEEIKNKSVAVVNISYDKDVLKERRLRGAGYFVGSSENHELTPQSLVQTSWQRPHHCMIAISVVVGSQSAPKLEAARQGFERLGSASVEVTGVEADSGVSAQPFGMEETRLGALNRLKAARASAEGTVADFCIAFEGGVEEDAEGVMACFAVVCVQFRDDDFISQVRSATHSVPPGITKMLRDGIELGVATDRFFADRVEAGYGKHTGGTIGALSYGVVDRVEFYAQPACLSLVPFLNADAYGISRTNPLHRGPAG
ncbi:unnamed protein product [Cladocopium goreaui]|uniref:inosine/xanthosine triphosphatase n=1 Tax=Cladocopium goreaui TaxID=2562237 RepID=A0A9P1C622_9DINO|nr:unnamed protein product [Cladocopium goreaui]